MKFFLHILLNKINVFLEKKLIIKEENLIGNVIMGRSLIGFYLKNYVHALLKFILLINIKKGLRM